MKHKLNLNEPGSRQLSIALSLLASSVALYGFAWILGRYLVKLSWLKDLAWLLAGAGALLLLVMAILLAVEAFQDRAMEASYRKQRSRRLPAENGLYECQYCGCRRVREADTLCPVCGHELQPGAKG
jgi:uncharacterized paraquat-inducible protein A